LISANSSGYRNRAANQFRWQCWDPRGKFAVVAPLAVGALNDIDLQAWLDDMVAPSTITRSKSDRLFP
jgi:hypothetical protein